MSEPTNLSEVVDAILTTLTPANIQDICEMGEDDISCIISGMSIRNNFGLWDDHSQLSMWFESHDIHHADDMSEVIMKELWRRVNNKDSIDLVAEAKKFQDHWDATIS